MMSQSGPCPRSSSCEECGALPGRSRYFSEISRGNKGDVDYDGRSGSGGVSGGLARADVRWNVGVVLGLLVGGLCYGRGLGWGLLSGRPAFVACAAASSSVLIAAAVWWGWGQRGEGGGGGGAGGARNGISCFWRRRQAGRIREGGGSWGWSFRRNRKLSEVGYARSGGQEEAEGEEGDEAETPLLGDVSVHHPGLVSAELPRDKARDEEAGEGGGAVSSR